MDTPAILTDALVTAYLKCKYKAYLKLTVATGEVDDYETLQLRLAAEYRERVRQNWPPLRGATAIAGATPLAEALASAAPVLTGVTVEDAGESCRLDALVRTASERSRTRVSYVPVLFIHRERPTPIDRLLLAFGASILARIQGGAPAFGKIVYGATFHVSRVKLAPLLGRVRAALKDLRSYRDASQTPPLLLNKHCVECEFPQALSRRRPGEGRPEPSFRYQPQGDRAAEPQGHLHPHPVFLHLSPHQAPATCGRRPRPTRSLPPSLSPAREHRLHHGQTAAPRGQGAGLPRRGRSARPRPLLPDRLAHHRRRLQPSDELLGRPDCGRDLDVGFLLGGVRSLGRGCRAVPLWQLRLPLPPAHEQVARRQGGGLGPAPLTVR